MIQSFLYTLMRDHLTPGVVEAIVRDTEKGKNLEIIYSNQFLAGYAAELTARLSGSGVEEEQK